VNHGVDWPSGSIFITTSTPPTTTSHTSPSVTTVTPPPTPPTPPPEPPPDDDGEIIPLGSEEWLDRVLRDRVGFAAALVESGLDEETVKDGLKTFDEVTQQAAQAKYPYSTIHNRKDFLAFKERMYARAVKSRLARWAGLFEWRIEETASEIVRIPLFKLHSPKVEGSKVSYFEAGAEGGTSAPSWTVKVFGSGMAGSKKFGVKYKNTFVCKNGDCKLIYVPVTMKVEKGATYLRGRFVGRGRRAEMILKYPERVSKCIDSVSEEECSKELNPSEAFDDEFDFSKDTSGDVHKVEWAETWSETTELNLGLTALSSAADIKSVVTREREIGLVFELPAGHKYHLRKCRQVRGVSWAVDLQPTADAPPPPPPPTPEKRATLKDFLKSPGSALSRLWKKPKS
jgi:hypothetical protein